MGRPRNLLKDVGRVAGFFIKPSKNEKELQRRVKKRQAELQKVLRRKPIDVLRAKKAERKELAKFITGQRRKTKIIHN